MGQRPRRRLSSIVVPTLLVLVVVTGLVRRDQPEVYPFASWAMYSRVPGTLDYYSLRILEIDGEPVPGRPLVRDHPEFAARFDDLRAYQDVAGFGVAVNRLQRGQDTQDEVDRFRPRVEDRFGGRDVRYEVVNVSGEGIGLARDGVIEEELRFGSFTTP